MLLALASSRGGGVAVLFAAAMQDGNNRKRSRLRNRACAAGVELREAWYWCQASKIAPTKEGSAINIDRATAHPFTQSARTRSAPCRRAR